MITPMSMGWGNPRNLADEDMVRVEIFPGHMVKVRNRDVGVVMAALVRRLRAPTAGTGQTPYLTKVATTAG
jgi:hypothetical protein